MILRESPLPPPTPAGLTRVVSLGDSLGFATLGHLTAVRRFPFVPCFARHTVRDLAPADAHSPGLETIRRNLAHGGHTRAWGAVIEGVRTGQDLERATRAGYTTLTLDLSAFIENRADRLTPAELETALAVLGNEGVMPAAWITEHTGRPFDLDGTSLVLERAPFLRAVVKFARAIAHAQHLARHLATLPGPGPREIELSLDATLQPLSPLEHLVIALELRRRNVVPATLFPRFAGFESGSLAAAVDPAAFEARLRLHAAIARHFGPHKLGFDRASEAFALHPVIGRVCPDAFHLKTRAATTLEALRVVARTAPELFQEILTVARTHFVPDASGQTCLLGPADIPDLFRKKPGTTPEQVFVDSDSGRQFLRATAAAILGPGRTSRGRPLREAIGEVLLLRADLHRELLDARFTRIFTLLNQG